MQWIITGLGNPGREYADTRHNAGRIVVEQIALLSAASTWKEHGRIRAQVADSVIQGHRAMLVLPEGYMNNSGTVLRDLVDPHTLDHLVVVYDDLDLPLGTFRISFDRGSGGHNGVSSIADTFGTNAFVRIRIGISPTDTDGNIQKPQGEQAVLNFVMRSFTPAQRKALDDLSKEVYRALEILIEQGRSEAMNTFN